MNNPVLLATLGQRPQAITMALDWLQPRHHYEVIEILHTDPESIDGIGKAYKQLMPVLESDYEALTVKSRCLRDKDGVPINDITDLMSAETYFHAVATVLREYRIRNTPIHLLVAGGRKAMSVYATLAAALLFGEHDCVWTILTSQRLMEEKAFHIPRGRHNEVELVNLPVRPSRLLPGVIAEIPLEKLLNWPVEPPRQAFIAELTVEEKALVETLREHPYAPNKELGRYLNKSHKTIENQFQSIYSRLSGYYDLTGVIPSRKREMLLDVINGRV